MARTITQIKQSILDEKNAQSGLDSLNSTSQTAIWNLWIYITAVSMWILETLWDKFKVELESTIAAAPVMTPAWVQEKVFEFQYDTTTPQIISLVDFVPAYDPVDETKRIITRCSVKTLPSRIVSVKTAKNEPPEALDSTELSNLQGMLDDITPSGVQYNTISYAPDKMYLDADIYYNGQYSAIISGTVVTAIETYLKEIPFDGQFRLMALVDKIQAVAGVKDIVLNNVALRPDSIVFASKTYLLQNNTTVYNKYPLYAGYVIPEASPNGLYGSLTFIAEQ